MNGKYNRQFITGGVATIPSRASTFPRMVQSILHQVNILNVCANGRPEDFPQAWHDALSDTHIRIRFQGGPGPGDAGKFLLVNLAPRGSFYLSLDDDLIYPRGYVQRMILGVGQTAGALVTLHGRIYGPRAGKPILPIRSYYHGQARAVMCKRALKKSVDVDVPGSGVACFRTDKLRITMDDFPRPNMADIWLARACINQGLRRVALSHKEGWIRSLPRDKQVNIYRDHHREERYQTLLINQILAR